MPPRPMSRSTRYLSSSRSPAERTTAGHRTTISIQMKSKDQLRGRGRKGGLNSPQKRYEHNVLGENAWGLLWLRKSYARRFGELGRFSDELSQSAEEGLGPFPDAR
jgi:hypothetical protein